MKANFRKNWDFEDWKEEKGQTEFIFLMRLSIRVKVFETPKDEES